ncbi:MAG: hypothetical protein ABS948_08220 [Solibacillus sp.]
MSLTSLLKGKKPQDKAFQHIIKETLPGKGDFKTISGNLAFSRLQYTVQVPYNLVKPYNSGIIGTAFDYLARLMIARVVKTNSDQAHNDLVAENGVNLVSGWLRNYPTTLKRVHMRFHETREHFRKCSNHEQDIKDFIQDACFLAKLEQMYRTGLPPTNLLQEEFFDAPDDEVVRDLERLCKVFQDTFISTCVTPASTVIYNPTFGICSALAGGADGDIIIDGTLYDFKTGKDVGYKWQEAAQITGYYLFNELASEISEEESYTYKEIRQIAFYRARYGEVEYMEVGDFSAHQIQQAKQEFVRYFARNAAFIS